MCLVSTSAVKVHCFVFVLQQMLCCFRYERCTVFEQVSMHNVINFIKETHFYNLL